MIRTDWFVKAALVKQIVKKMFRYIKKKAAVKLYL
jgi:hypothetical protein